MLPVAVQRSQLEVSQAETSVCPGLTEPESTSLATACKEPFWCRELFLSIGISLTAFTIILQDTELSASNANSDRFTPWNEHFDI
mmetsp:Transcript_25369/g.32916  ORF Transcript_25369/g.32916 Transcript_25369/m.32916 type:complete len:85 (+) Transcript_25369:114-368(+)